MQENQSIDLKGQWFGLYSYSEEYGPEVHGESVTFSILIEDVFNYKFKGKCIEISGFEPIEEISLIEGFIQNDLISFQKIYKEKYIIG